MDNNAVLRSLRYILEYDDEKMAEAAALGGLPYDPGRMEAMLKKEEDDGFVPCDNETLVRFLDGLIVHRRGPSDKPRPEGGRGFAVNNNIILKKLRIAFAFREEDMIRTFEKGGFGISGTEITALFRKRGHKHYRDCGDQLLRKFLKGLSVKD
ncbi:MAG: DUF1456 family protein [Spirochaetia bacterium]